MGRFHYDNHTKMEFDDRLLAHLQVVIGNKLRRGESFFFTWKEDPSVGDGRHSVWIHPDGDLSFRYFGSRRPALNHAWLEALSITANSNRGLYVIPEPEMAIEAGPPPEDLVG